MISGKIIDNKSPLFDEERGQEVFIFKFRVRGIVSWNFA